MPSDGILKLQTKVPETIALQYSDGRPTQSQFGGDQMLFTLTDGRRMSCRRLSPTVSNSLESEPACRSRSANARSCTATGVRSSTR